MNKKRVEAHTPSGAITISKRLLFFAGTLLVVIGFVAGTRSSAFAAILEPLTGIKTTNQTLDVSKLEQVYQLLRANYDGKVDDQVLLDGALHGMVTAAGDKWTMYLTPKEADDLQKDLNGDIGGGIGAEIGVKNGQPTIMRILPGNPAEAAGLEVGDQIVSINDQSADGWSADKAVGLIRGKEGTTVRLTIKRGGQDKQFTLMRATINNPSVLTDVQQGVGIMTISRFDDQTGALVRKAAESFQAQHVKGVIVDLRGDGGGYVDAAVSAASVWLDKDLVVSQHEQGKITDQRYATGNPVFQNMKTIVLINGGTASASEILSAALHDNGKATLLGETSFGKGTMQQIIPLNGGGDLKVTVAHWYTPKGVNVGGKGITPDVPVALTAADGTAGRDPQLDAALARLQ